MEVSSPHLRYLLSVGQELGKKARLFAIVAALTTIVLFIVSPRLLAHLQEHLHQKLVFFTVAGPFLAHVKLSFFAALLCLMPWIVHLFWHALARPFKLSARLTFAFVLGTLLLFYAGALFCYTITLPYGVNFLLGYQSDELRPLISVSEFVSFVTIFILAFGLIFELPVFMVFLAKVGLYSRQKFEKNRRYAVLVISIVAALLTPTPDVFNMMLMGVPLYGLYESGILALKVLRL